MLFGAAVCVALAPAAPAAAQAPPATSPEARSLAIARRRGASLSTAARAGCVSSAGRFPATWPGRRGGGAPPDVNSRLGRPPFRALCTVIVHEYGHVLGFGHIRNRRDILHPVYADGPYWGPCLSARDRATARRRGIGVDDAVNRGSYPAIGRPGVDD